MHNYNGFIVNPFNLGIVYTVYSMQQLQRAFVEKLILWSDQTVEQDTDFIVLLKLMAGPVSTPQLLACMDQSRAYQCDEAFHLTPSS